MTRKYEPQPGADNVLFQIGAMLLVVSFILGLMAARTSRGASPAAAPYPYRLPSVNIKQPVIWGSTCEGPDGIALSFGGEDLASDDGLCSTRLRVDGKWIDLRETFAKDPRAEGARVDLELARIAEEGRCPGADDLFLGSTGWIRTLSELRTLVCCAGELSNLEFGAKSLVISIPKFEPALANNSDAVKAFETSESKINRLQKQLDSEGISAGSCRIREIQVDLEKIADMTAAEAAGAALSPIVFEPKSKLFVLFGGDHCDYLTCDTWTFDPKTAAGHCAIRRRPAAESQSHLESHGDGKLVLTGGYTYFSNTDYMGGQYIDIGDGPWTYDVANDTWTGVGKTAAPQRSNLSHRPVSAGVFL